MDAPLEPRPADGRVAAALALIAEKGYCKAAFAEFARSVNLSESRLRHLFKQQVGLSPSACAKQLKIRKARRIAEGSPYLTVKELAALAGAPHMGRFARDFIEILGLTPSDFLSQCRGTKSLEPSGSSNGDGNPPRSQPKADQNNHKWIGLAKSGCK